MWLIVSVESLACNVRNASEKAYFYQKSRSWFFVYMSLEVAFPHFSTISVQTFHNNVCSNKELRLSKKKSFISAI